MSEAKPPHDNVEKALEEATLAAMRYEESGHLTDEEKELAKREEDERKRRVKERLDMLQVLKAAEGRRILFRILEVAGEFKPSYDPASSRQTDFNEGARSVGIELHRMIDFADPSAYIQMLNEHASDEKVEKERKRKEN